MGAGQQYEFIPGVQSSKIGVDAFGDLVTTAARIYTSNGTLDASTPTPSSRYVSPTGDSSAAGKDSANIQAAMNALSAAGGGVVTLSTGAYYLNSALVPQPGVTVRGVSWQFNFDNSSLVSGTILAPGAGAPASAFTYNAVAAGSQPVDPQTTAIYGTGLEDLAFQNFSGNAVQFGALMATGAFFSRFKNLIALNCTGWSFYFENCSLCQFENINSLPPAAGATGGQFYGASQINWGHGNSRFSYLFHQGGGQLSRGIVVQARDGGGSAGIFNDLNFFSVQSNNNTSGAATVTQAATMTNSSANIGVTDGTKFAVDMPVSFSATANGFTQYVTYFVVSVVGNVIQVANQQRGTAISATGNTAVNVTTSGFPGIELSALASNASNNIQQSWMAGVDCESTGACQILIQKSTWNLSVGTIRGAVPFPSIVARSCFGRWDCQNNITTDFDSVASQFFYATQAYILSDTYGANATIQNAPIGMYYDRALQQPVVNLSYGRGLKYSLHSQNEGTGSAYLYPDQAMGQKVTRNSSTSLNLFVGYGGCVIYTGSGAATWVLPAVITADPGASFATVGAVFEIVNGASAAVAVTLNTSSSQGFGYGGNAKTSYSIPRGGSITVRAAYDGTNGFWAVLSNNGAT